MMQIECKNLTLEYEQKIVAKDVNFKVNKGDYLCIIGENGSGKSTLMKTILGLRSYKHGQIIYDKSLKEGIGYLPQQAVIQKDFPASVKEIVLSGFLGKMGMRPCYSSNEKNIASDNLKKLQIDNLADRCFRELSGGQQQRVLLARALCATKEILLLDEPVSGLDFQSTEKMYEIIDGLNKEGITIIMISHDLASAIKYASHILHIGKNIFYGTKEEFLNTDIYKEIV